MAVNLRGPYFLAQAFVRRLRDAKKPGRIINISSVHEDMAFPGFTTYCCSKGGMRMMMHNLTVELGPLGNHRQQHRPPAPSLRPSTKLSLKTSPNSTPSSRTFPSAASAPPKMSPPWSPSLPPTTHPI